MLKSIQARTQALSFISLSAALLASLASPSAWAETVRITILHTNDIHSHFRPDLTPLSLGGIARIKTAVNQIRRENPNTLFVDGGDWSEGNIYYTEGGGREVLRTMDLMGYDAAVVGNHDWLNGPDLLLRIMQQAHPKMSVIASNMQTDQYARADELQKLVPPYVIKDIGGIKVAFIGLLTYEFIYDKYFAPVKIVDPYAPARQLSAELKRKADVVIAISHNQIGTNQKILDNAPDIDLVIGAHDHVKLTEPVVVERFLAPPGWVVEAGAHARYLGRVDIDVDTSAIRKAGMSKAKLVNYKLIQMDSSVAEDPAILAHVENLEKSIERHYGPIFHDHIGDSNVAIDRNGFESLMGAFATDAYREFTQADAALDMINFVYGQLPRGAIRTVDVFNSNPGVYNPATDKTWSVQVFPIKGSTLKFLLGLLFTNKRFSELGALNVSGMQIAFDPLIRNEVRPGTPRSPFFINPPVERTVPSMIRDISIQGHPLESDQVYKIAGSGGIVETLRFINSYFPSAIPLENLKDTGREAWRVIGDHLRATTPVTIDKIPLQNRVQSVEPDLAIYEDDIQWAPVRTTSRGMVARVKVRVRSLGVNPAPAGTHIQLFTNQNGIDYGREPDYRAMSEVRELPEIAPGESTVVEFPEITVPQDRGIYGITARVSDLQDETIVVNNEVTRWFHGSR